VRTNLSCALQGEAPDDYNGGSRVPIGRAQSCPVSGVVDMHMAPSNRFSLLALLLAVALAACSSLSSEERDQKRSELDRMGEDALARLLERNPELVSVFDEAVGHAVIDARLTKIPGVGYGSGKGVVVDHRDGERRYVKAWRLDVGGGLGARAYKLLFAFTDEELFEKAERGSWKFGVGVEAGVGESSAEGATGDGGKRGFTCYTLAEKGASATWTVRAIRLSPYLR
jgi:hypothetical protein